MKIVIFDDVLFRAQGDFVTPGLDLVFVEHADDCVEVVTHERPNLVLMDYAMGAHLCGADAIEVLRKAFPRGRLRIVAISSDPMSNERMLDVGADDALRKSHLKAYLSRLGTGR